MSAVTAIAKAPPSVTRSDACPHDAPPRKPPYAPRNARLIKESTPFKGMRRDSDVTRRTATGIAAKKPRPRLA